MTLGAVYQPTNDSFLDVFFLFFKANLHVRQKTALFLIAMQFSNLNFWWKTTAGHNYNSLVRLKIGIEYR